VDIRMLDNNDAPKAKALWKQAFGDSDAFTDTYFENKLRLGQTGASDEPARWNEAVVGESIGLFDGGDLVSVVHMLPYAVRVQGRPLKSAYIAGAATDKARRGEGLMKKMLRVSLEWMRDKGVLMTHLYPFKHSFYEKYGWATYSYVEKVSAAGAGAAADIIETRDSRLLHTMYHNMTRELDGYVVRDARMWRWRLSELFSDGGKAYVLLKEGVPAAYMMAYDDDGRAEAVETVYACEADAGVLADGLLARGYSEVRYNLSAKSAAFAPHGMARIVDAAALLKEFGAEDALESVRVTDAFAPWNNTGSPNAPYSVEIAAFAKIAHGDWNLPGIGDRRQAVLINAFGSVFRKRDACIFEEY